MPERVLAVLQRHPGETLATSAIADEAGADNEDLVYQALRRLVLNGREGVKQVGPGLWRFDRRAGDARFRVVGDGE